MSANILALLCRDCLSIMQQMPENTIDAIVTDPPYGLKFMGKDWDHGLPGVAFWKEALRISKPGAHLLAFGGTRTFHRLAVAIEDAGWEIRDCLMWVYGTGFPKSLDVSKAIDKTLGAKRKVVGKYQPPNGQAWNLAQADGKSGGHAPGTFTASGTRTLDITAPATDAAEQWQGWGTGLKPAYEPIIVARKPLEGTVAENVQKWETGALNIDACRVPHASDTDLLTSQAKNPGRQDLVSSDVYGANRPQQSVNTTGRWPSNLIHDGSNEVVELFPNTGKSTGGVNTHGHDGTLRMGRTSGQGANAGGLGDVGSAARFFYCAKASRSERGEGNSHPTVKALALMKYLIKLVTREGQIVLDPFMGSGTTIIAATALERKVIGIEKDESYFQMALKRIEEQTNNDK